jgi:hypothetical protein
MKREGGLIGPAQRKNRFIQTYFSPRADGCGPLSLLCSFFLLQFRHASRLRSHARATERCPDRAATLQKAQRMIAGCEACSDDAEIPFDNILDRVTGSDPSVTDYVLEAPARCLQCGAEINEKTLVVPL